LQDQKRRQIKKMRIIRAIRLAQSMKPGMSFSLGGARHGGSALDPVLTITFCCRINTLWPVIAHQDAAGAFSLSLAGDRMVKQGPKA
jgi:hypothetical protein